MLINREHSRLSSQVKTLEKVLHAPFSGLHGTPTFKKRKRAERCAQVSRERLREAVEDVGLRPAGSPSLHESVQPCPEMHPFLSRF